MMKKPFFGLSKPRVVYPPSQGTFPALKSIPTPSRATLLIKGDMASVDPDVLKKGDAVKTGQKISLAGGNSNYAISSVTGTIDDISVFEGDFGNIYIAVSIAADRTDVIDEQFGAVADSLSRDDAVAYFQALPGGPDFSVFADEEKEIQTIAVYAEDQDLLVNTNRYAATSLFENLKAGIEVLKTVTGVENIVLVTPRDRIQNYGSIGAQVKAVDTAYPSANPKSIMKDVLGTIVPAGQTPEDMGVVFFSAEAVAAVGSAMEAKALPVTKILTVIHKDGSQTLVSARIGTPIRDVVAACKESLSDRDRLIVGGPMTGRAIFTEAHPVQCDTDAVMLQDKDRKSVV